MDAESDLKTALTETLENGGVLRSLRAGLRTEILRALEEPRPSEQLLHLPPENCLINELVLEYLSFNNYRRTESILEAESGYRRSCVGRAFLEKELNVAPSEKASRLPLLYAIVETLRTKTSGGAADKG
ncbi:centrosomal protein 20 [Ixodes scapularis]|uniref:centrosomal protein 20 n=1 Tax=Ixodes scapularis TaxID=6945 RepID=UPI001A9DA203|nr:centrosomal protein 20 [Ixodes scapularis]